MKKIMAGACAVMMAVTSFGAVTVPAAAAPLQLTSEAQFITVQDRGRDRDRDRRWDRERRWDGNRDNRRGFERRGGYSYYNGHRGSRDRRAGWRQHNGYWFPPAAFIAGAIIGGAISSQNNNSNSNVVRITREHIRYCENRYRSYRASDNTFQPYNGPRQQCVSPYL
ncbi:BA14K family protein [Devosia submarina]|uniref:BA14K family protein n=1 Tax=Devosia submarina TaxID=1173082 RepID=UPI000D3977B4|nr:BA14K family protein [Devosia submarina]